MTCGDCKWAEFSRTATGRIRKDLSGNCTAPVPKLKDMPYALQAKLPGTWPGKPYGIWPDEHEGCPVYKKVD